MTEITQSRMEDAVASTSAFLNTERGTGVDGAFAGEQIADRVEAVRDRVEGLLRSDPIPGRSGWYAPLSNRTVGSYEEAAAVLPGYFVLVPSALVETGVSAFYPAVVSEDGIRSGSLRLHVLKQAYRQQISSGSATILSAAGQSETKGIGDHSRAKSDGVEAEHFATLLAAGSDPGVQAAWQAGRHVNHTWRERPGNSVTAEVSQRLFGQSIPQQTITITRQDIAAGKALLLWHEGMRDGTGHPETAAKAKALVIVQSLGYEALREQNPKAIDVVKRLIA